MLTQYFSYIVASPLEDNVNTILNLKEISLLEKVLYGKEREEDLILFHYRPGPGLPPDKSCQ
jgi:hypothetical protein